MTANLSNKSPFDPFALNRVIRPTIFYFLLLILIPLLFPYLIKGEGAILPPENVRAFDTPNDDGGSITLTWKSSPDDSLIAEYQIFRSDGKGEFVSVGTLPSGEKFYTLSDENVKNKTPYTYKIVAVSQDKTVPSTEVTSNIVVASAQWFNTFRINVLIGVVVFTCLIAYFIYYARKGKQLFIRRISGLQAVDEAVGRATEMGKPILYVPGLSTVSDIATIASLNILGEVAKKTARYETTLLVPNRDPIVYTVAFEVVKGAYTDAGRPDLFKPDNVFFITDSQFAYAAAVDGIMVREKPATNFFLGMFWAESLILAETGAGTGAVQIAGTDSIHQLPFFITACDYTLIGEELYAASAYLSREPLLLGSIKGQDYGKFIILVLLLISSGLLLVSALPKFSFLNQVWNFFNVR